MSEKPQAAMARVAPVKARSMSASSSGLAKAFLAAARLTKAALAPARLTTAALAVAALAALAACERKDGNPVQLAAEASPSDVQEALVAPLARANPAGMQKGAFAYWRDIQTLAAAVSATVADTGQTVDSRDDSSDDNYIIFNLIERKLTYAGQQAREVVTEREAAARKPRPTPAPGPRLALSGPTEPQEPLRSLEQVALSRGFPGGGASGEGPGLEKLFFDAGVASGLSSGLELALASRLGPIPAPLGRAFAASPSATPSPRISFHGLKRSVATVAAPELTQKRPGCGGLPGCALALYTIEFDQVIWTSAQPDKIHYQFQMSPDVPYLAALMNRCATTLVPIGSAKTLLTQCSPILDFRF